ncbi:acs-9 [Pristionchus pacificus]|uniref:Acs-9 n=1 Tax=Pristionchus pacificus TaxID=54126 RepID=A0A2A6C7E7_PRIPA|nr:acs-9 [Pristionchus pacificus]|eukprot:PDM73998.1 acs-9 [Pristionchus pacificus]
MEAAPLVIPSEPFHVQILNSCDRHGCAIALTDADSKRSLTFQDVKMLSNRLASEFKKIGVEKVNIDELTTYIQQTRARFIVACSEQAERLQGLEGVKVLLIETLLVPATSDELEGEFVSDVVIGPDSTLLAPFSSGTTGTPKCALLTHDNYSAATASLKAGLFDGLNVRKESTLAMLPFYHASGFWALLYCLMEGHHSIIVRGFSVGRMLELIEKYEISIINVVPSIVVVLARVEQAMPSLRIVLCGSAPLGKELSEALLQRHPSIEHLIQGYGMTEVVVLSHATPPSAALARGKYGSCGKLLPGFEAKIVNEVGEQVEVGETGELLLRGRAVIRSYLVQGCPLDGWLRTGDLVRVDIDGFYFIVDRLKDVFKVHGKQVSPAEIEDLLLSHSAIAQAAVIGIPDEHAGHVPRAFIVLRGEEYSETVQEIAQFVKDRLSPHKHLKGGIRVVDELPMSSSGKVLRRVLQEQSIEVSEL